MRKCTGVVFALVLLASVCDAQDYRRIGGMGFLSYNLPVLSLRDNWYSQAIRWGGSLVYSVDQNLTMEFEYNRIKYKNGKIQERTFVWNVDNKAYGSPNASADMKVDSAVMNFLFRLGDKSGLFAGQTSSPYLVFGTGFHSYKNRVSGLVYPGQTVAPLDMGKLLEPQLDRRAALGVNFGFGVERFLSKNFSLDFRVQHNFLVGTLSPRETWGVGEVWPMQMLDLGVALKFYESGD